MPTFLSVQVEPMHVQKVFSKVFSRNKQLLVRGEVVSYVRPILEDVSSTWSPSTIANIKRVESVQRLSLNVDKVCTMLSTIIVC